MNASSFTAGADDRAYAATTTGFRGGFAGALIEVVASGRARVLGADKKDGTIGSVSNTGNTIIVIVSIDQEDGASEWNVIDGIEMFTGSFIIKL